MMLFLLVSVLVSAANCGELYWGDATEITDNGLFSLQCQHDGKVSVALLLNSDCENISFF